MARTLDFLRRGTRIHTLFYATHLARHPDRRYDVTWEGLAYKRTDPSGAYGTVLFGKSGVLALFHDPKSPRSPKVTGKKSNIAQELKGVPPALSAVAKREALPAMTLDTDDPAVTAAFWSDPAGALAGARPFTKLFEDGAHLVEAELEKPDACIAALTERYGFDDATTKVIREVFASKAALAMPANGKVVLPPGGRDTLGLLPDTATRELLQGAAIELG